MAKEHELDERLDRVEAFIEQLESGGPSWAEGERLFQEGRQTLAEFRDILDRGEGMSSSCRSESCARVR